MATRRFDQRLETASGVAGLERRRLLQWILASGGLSAVWSLASESAETALAIARQAAAKLQQSR